MKKRFFENEMQRAEAKNSESPDYWSGYQRGLRRRFHGEDFGTDAEHKKWLTADGDESRRQESQGYRDGYFGPVDWENIPETIKIIRKWRGWNTAEFGEKIDASYRTVEGWEQGHRTPSKSVLKLIRLISETE